MEEAEAGEMTEFERWLESKNVRLTPIGLDLSLRDGAIAEFGFAVLTWGVAEKLSRLSPILEVGAGGGYWAWELRRAGADIVATDPDPLSDIHLGLKARRREWVAIERLSAVQAIDKYPGRALLMGWPSYSVTWPSEALQHFRKQGGKSLVYVGEGEGGCTGDDGYHEELAANWELREEIPIPQWWGVHDVCFVYKRKGGILE